MINRTNNIFEEWDCTEDWIEMISTEYSDTCIYTIPKIMVSDICKFFDQYVKSKTEITGDFEISKYDDTYTDEHILKLNLHFSNGDSFGIGGRIYLKYDDDDCGDYYHNFELELENVNEWNEFYKLMVKEN